MSRMAMFPLGSVLLPGAVLPLHVFEPRYRRLVEDCLSADEHEFGVVLIDRGHEVGGGDIRNMVGTVARIVQVAKVGDDRLAVISVGTRRIRITEWLPDDPYPQAEVEDWGDDHHSDADGAALGDLASRTGAAFATVRRINALAAEVGETPVDLMAEISDDPVLGGYHLCALAPLGPADLQRLLEAPDPAARLTLLLAALDDVEAALQFRLLDGGHDDSSDGGSEGREPDGS